MSFDSFDYTGFISNRHFLDSVAVQEDCGKYFVKLKSYDFITFDRILTNSPHKHECFEMCLVLNGSGEYNYAGRKYRLTSGDLFIADPGITHEISSFRTKDLYLVFLFFSITEADIPLTGKNEDILVSDFVKSHKVLVSGSNLLFHYLPLLLVDKDNKKQKRNLNKAITTKAWFFDCIAGLSEDSGNISGYESGNRNVELAVSYIMKNITKNILIGDIADYALVSERYLRFLFKKYYDMSVSRFIQKEKVVLAENKLRMGLKINEAAEYIGVGNSSQFSKLFKKINGVTPKQYCDIFDQLK